MLYTYPMYSPVCTTLVIVLRKRLSLYKYSQDCRYTNASLPGWIGLAVIAERLAWASQIHQVAERLELV